MVPNKLSVRVRQTLRTDGELRVTRTNDVLNLELGELGIKARCLHDTPVLVQR